MSNTSGMLNKQPEVSMYVFSISDALNNAFISQ